MRWMLRLSLDSTMCWFQRTQDGVRKQGEGSFGLANPLSTRGEVGRKSMVAFEQAMRLLNPFVPPPAPSRESGSEDAPAVADDPAGVSPAAPGKEAQNATELLRRDLSTEARRLGKKCVIPYSAGGSLTSKQQTIKIHESTIKKYQY